MPPQQVPDNKMTMAQTLDLVYCAACVAAACFYPLTRYRMGVRAMGWAGFGAFCVILGLAQAWHSEALSLYLTLWLIAGAIQLFTRDKSAHSKSSGTPILFLLVRHYRVAVLLEMALVMWVASVACYALFPGDPAFQFFMVGGAVMGMKEGIEDVSRREFARITRDGEIEARNRAEAFRRW